MKKLSLLLLTVALALPAFAQTKSVLNLDKTGVGNLAKAEANWPGLVEKKGK